MDAPKHSVSSRLSTSTMSLFGKFSRGPPRPPPKDNWYIQNQFASKSSVSLAPTAQSISLNSPLPSPYGALAQNERGCSSHETLQVQVPHAPPLAIRSHSDLSTLSIPRTMSPVSTCTTNTLTFQDQQNQHGGSFRRGFAKLSSSLGRRTTIRQGQTQNPPATARRQTSRSFFSRSNSSQNALSLVNNGSAVDNVAVYESSEGEEDSRVWDFKHNVHVDENLNGLPAEWMEKLREDGMRDSDIISTHSRRQHRTTYLKNHPDISPDIIHSRTNSPFSPSTITSYPYSQSNVSNSNIGSSPSSSPVDERVSSPLTSSNHNHSLMNGASTDNTCQPATRTNGTGNAIPASALPTRSTSLRRPMGNLNGPRNASGRRQTTDSNAPYRLSHAHSDSTGRTPSLSTSSSHQSHLGEAFGYDESCAAGEAHENIHDGGIDVETEDDPNTATAAQFTIPNSATAAAFRQEGGNGGVGHGPGNGIERSIQGGFLPRMDEEPEDHHFLAHSDQRSQSPRSYSSSDEHLHPSERSCIANGPKVHGLKLRTRTDTASTMGTFRVVNASPPSPPPAYDPPPAGSPLEQYAQGRVGEKQSSNRLSPTPEGAEYRRSEETLTPKALLRGSLTNEESEDAEDEEPIRAPALPPRLSFNQEDFGSFDWSESLLSSLGTSVQTDVATTASTAPSLPLLEPAMKENPQPSETAPLSSPPKKSATVSPLVLSKGPAIPNVVIEIDQVQADSEEASGDMMQRQSSEGGYSSGRSISTTPLFNEVLSLVRQVPSSYGSNGSESSYVNSIANSNPKRGTDSPPLTSTYPYLPDPPSRPSPPRSAPVHSTQPSRSPSLSPAYSANLPSPPIPSPSFSPRSTDSHTESRASSSLQGYDYDFLNNPPSSNIRNSGTVREDRWSCTTTGTVATVRDVKEATIVHVRKASVGLANAFTVPAPSRSTSNPQLQAGSSSSSPISRDLSPARAREISAERGGGDTRRESYMSSDSNCSPEPAPVAEDFPLPPPSPISPSKGKFAAQPSPLSPTFSMNSNSGTVLAYLHPGLHSPRLSTAFHVPTTAKESVFVASPPPTIQTARDKPLSTSPAPSPSCSSSSSSSTSLQRSESKTVSATSCEDEPSPPLPTTVVSTPEPMSKKPAGKPAQFKIELRRSVGGHILSPTDSYLSGTSTESWLNGDGGSMVLDLEPIGVVIDANLSPNAAANTNGGNGQMRLSRGSSVGLAEPVMDWLVDSPSPSQIQSPALRDSVMMLGTSPKSQATSRETGNVEKEEFTSPRRPAITTEGIKSPSLSAIHVAKQQQNFLSPASANTSRSSNSTNSNNLSPSPSSVSSPLARYRGWVSEVVAPLEEFIDHDVEPREIFADMTEIAEGESGSVFSATLISLPSSRSSSSRSRTPPPPSYALSFSSQRESRKAGTKVAIKNVPLLPGGSPKLEDLRREMMLMSRVRHENVLSMDALYVDLVDDALWIEMELMERSLADVLALGDAGLRLDESTIARFSCDVLCALAYLEDQGIVHRDLRSDNLLVNSEGVLKIADFSHALLVDTAYPTYSEPAGVVYWQAPEMRSGSYNSLKVDVWSLGATAWEMAECIPPFMDMDISDPRRLPKQWPPLSEKNRWSSDFEEFLGLCSRPERERPGPMDLIATQFIASACPRAHVIDILTQCRTLEQSIHHSSSASGEDSDGTVS